jgi:hypothetical protein
LFAINECEVHCKSKLNTVTVGVDQYKTTKLRSLIDTGAEISIVSCTKLKLGFNCEPTNGINIKEICDALLRTEDTVLLKLFTPKHETTHLFHVMVEDCLQI